MKYFEKGQRVIIREGVDGLPPNSIGIVVEPTCEYEGYIGLEIIEPANWYGHTLDGLLDKDKGWRLRYDYVEVEKKYNWKKL